MFSQMSVCPRGVYTPPGRHPLGRQPPGQLTPPGQTPPGQTPPPSRRHCSGQYASYCIGGSKGASGMRAPGVQILSFSCSFRQIIALFGFDAPPQENPGSATVLECILVSILFFSKGKWRCPRYWRMQGIARDAPPIQYFI